MAVLAEGRAVFRAMASRFAALPGTRRDKDGPVPSGGLTDRADALRNKPPSRRAAEPPSRRAAMIASGAWRGRLASSTTRDARATTNGEYDTFVENRAKAGHSAITDGCAGKFTALISTMGWSAKQNTSTRSTDTDASIWWLAGQKVADDYADFYDGSWDSRNHKNEYGGTTSHDRVWTGSLNNGNAHPTQYAGLAIGNTRVARLGSGSPLSSDARSSAQANRIFGLSPIFTVVKDPRLSVRVAKTSANETNTRGHFFDVTVSLDKARSAKTTFKLCVKNTSTATFRTSTSANTRDFDLYEHTQARLSPHGRLIELPRDGNRRQYASWRS